MQYILIIFCPLLELFSDPPHITTNPTSELSPSLFQRKEKKEERKERKGKNQNKWIKNSNTKIPNQN